MPLYCTLDGDGGNERVRADEKEGQREDLCHAEVYVNGHCNLHGVDSKQQRTHQAVAWQRRWSNQHSHPCGGAQHGMQLLQQHAHARERGGA